MKIQVNSQNENDFKFWSKSNRRSYVWRYIASISKHLLFSDQKIKKDLSRKGNFPSRKARPIKYYTHTFGLRQKNLLGGFLWKRFSYKNSVTGVSLWICEILRSPFFEEHLCWLLLIRCIFSTNCFIMFLWLWNVFSNFISHKQPRSYSVKSMFLQILQNLQENTCDRVSFFTKVAGLSSATLLKKRL